MKLQTLHELLGSYFDSGVAEGAEGRNHDTPEGTAQKNLNAIIEHVKGLIKDEREQCAKTLEMRNDEIRLLAGELTANEMRTTQAILTNRATVIRRRSERD